MSASSSSSAAAAAAGGDVEDTNLFDDVFEVLQVNPEGKKFEKVSRLVCKATTYDVDMIVDVASGVFSLKKDDKFTLTIVTTLRLDGRKDDDAYDQSGRETLLDKYDYGMCGRVFQFDIKEGAVTLTASFGGLLMKLDGDLETLSPMGLDKQIYALFRKAKASSA